MSEPTRVSAIEALLPGLARRVSLWRESVVAACGVEPVVIETIRTPERQDWLYESGRSRPGLILTKLRGSDSAARHVAKWGEGRAFDFMWKHEDPWGDRRPWALAGAIGVSLGFRWGGAWGALDLGHLEWTK